MADERDIQQREAPEHEGPVHQYPDTPSSAGDLLGPEADAVDWKTQLAQEGGAPDIVPPPEIQKKPDDDLKTVPLVFNPNRPSPSGSEEKDPFLEKRLGPVILEKKITASKHGTLVYLARLPKMNVPMVIKFVPVDNAKQASLLHQEIDILRKLDHPYIQTYFDSGIAQGYVYLVTEYYERPDLRNRLHRTRRFTTMEVIAFLKRFLGIADALDYIRGEKIRHRDIKPGNIYARKKLDGGGTDFVLGDFGLAIGSEEISSDDGMSSAGTPDYIPPEELFGSPHLNSDLYSLGAVLFEALTGLRLEIKELKDIVDIVEGMVKGRMAFPDIRIINRSHERSQVIKEHQSELEWMRNPAKENMKLPDAIANLIMRFLTIDPQKRLPKNMTVRTFVQQAIQEAEQGIGQEKNDQHAAHVFRLVVQLAHAKHPKPASTIKIMRPAA